MKLDKYEGVTAEYKYKEGVLTLLERIIELLEKDTPKEDKPKTRKKKEVK